MYRFIITIVLFHAGIMRTFSRVCLFESGGPSTPSTPSIIVSYLQQLREFLSLSSWRKLTSNKHYISHWCTPSASSPTT